LSRIEISKKLVLINSASSLATRMLSLSVLVWLQQYLLKRISPEEYSLLPLLYSVMAFAPLITTVLTGGLGRFITVAYARDDDEEVTRIVSTMFPILCVAGVLFLAGGWTFAWYIDRVLTIAPERVWDARIMMAILMFSAAVRLPLAPFGAGFFVRQKFVLENLIQVGTELFRLTLLFTLLFGVSTRVLWIITASTVAELVNLTITRSISMRLVPALRFRIKAIHWPIAKEITSFGGWSFVAQAADTVRSSADAIILNKFATPIDLGAFHIGSLPARHAQGASMAIRGPMAPALTSFYSTGRTDRLAHAYIRIGRLNLLFYLGIAVPLSVFSPEIIKLYAGDRYAMAAVVMPLLLTSLVFPYMCTLLPVVASAMNSMKMWGLVLVTVNGLNLATTLFFVWGLGLGAVGSALGTLVAGAVGYPIAWAMALRLLRMPASKWFRECVLPGVLPGLVAGLVCFAARSAMTLPTTWIALGVALLICCAIYATVAIVCCHYEDRAVVQSAVRRLVHVSRRPRVGTVP